MTTPIPDISRPAEGGTAYGRRLFLSTELAGRREIRYAQAAVLVSMLFFVVAAPFATAPLAQVPAFLPIYQSALVVCYLITAVLLYSYFSLQRSRALLVLASGYLFTALIAIAHALTLPGMFSATGLLGAGAQSAAWLSMFWHGGFPLAVIAYALIKVEPHAAAGTDGLPRVQAPSAILCGVALVLIVVGGLVLLATAGKDLLPAVMQANQYSPAMPAIASGPWLPGLLALAVLGWRRPHTVIDLWLMVMMCAWLFDIALAVVLNGGRYDLGWYAGRIYGLLASSFLLIVLLIENGRNYSRLIRMTAKLSNANQTLERLSMRDALTELANRRAFDAYLAEQIAVARRHQRPLALVLCDVDAFKAYNDHYGHQAGDACLKQLAAALRSCCRRPADMAARYGGEEFAMILPDTDPIGAARIAEAARDAVLQLRLPHARSPAAPFVSISGGVAVLLRRIDISPHQLITVADQTLYKAKHLGRNRMVFARIES